MLPLRTEGRWGVVSSVKGVALVEGAGVGELVDERLVAKTVKDG